MLLCLLIFLSKRVNKVFWDGGGQNRLRLTSTIKIGNIVRCCLFLWISEKSKPCPLRGCGGTAGSPHWAKRFTAPGVTGWLDIRQEGTESPMEKGQAVCIDSPHLHQEKTRESVFFQLYSFLQNELYCCAVILATPVIFACGERKRMNIISLKSKTSISLFAKQII